MIMEISIIGKPHKIDRKQVRKAVQFYAEDLMTPQLRKNISVQILFTKNMLKKTGNFGGCDQESNYPYNPRDFILELDDNLCKRTTLFTIAHEMAHVKQYATGELKDEYIRLSNTVRWRGKYYKVDQNSYLRKNHDVNRYPFEKDANRWEKKLYNRWKEAQNDLL